MKVIITADIHVYDYPNYNYSFRSRLKQFRKLAERLVELGKQNDCDEIWILGDIVDKPNSKAYVLHEAKEFLKILCKGFKAVRYTLGNHDLDSKSDQLTSFDAQITLLDFDNLIYMDQQLLTFGTHTYGFMNWRPSQDLSWLGDKSVDILFGHYTKSTLFGQEIDESKFDLMIHGDIHNDQVIGKFVSVCNPIQKDMSSQANGKVILFDTDSAEWSRLEVDEDHTRFLRMAYTTDQSKEGFDGELQYNIYKPIILNNVEVKTEELGLDWIGVTDLVRSLCKTNNVEDIHEEILNSSDLLQFSEVDYNFQLTYLKIHGYRSIEDLELTFNPGDRIALLGNNGSGKSSIIRALQGIFHKNSDLKYEQSDFTDDMSIILRLVYQNKEYEIHKGSSWGLWIEGEEQPYSGVRDFEADLKVKLPFFDSSDVMIFNSNVSELDSQFSSDRRIKLINDFYRLHKVSECYENANILYNEETGGLNEIKVKLLSQTSVIEHLKTRLEELKEYKDKDKSEYEAKLKEYQDLRDKYNSYTLWHQRVNDSKLQVDKLKDKLHNLQIKASFDYDQGVMDLKDLKDKAELMDQTYTSLREDSIKFETKLNRFRTVESRGIELNKKLESIKTGRCPECNSPLSSGDSKVLMEKYQTELTSLGSEWDSLEKELLTYPKGLDSKDYFIKTLKELSSSYKDLKDSIELLDNKLKNHLTFKTQVSVVSEELRLAENVLKDLEDNAVEKIELPYNLTKLESDAHTSIVKCEEYNSTVTQIEDLEQKSMEIQSEIDAKQLRLDKLLTYMSITNSTGIANQEIFKKLAQQFSTPQIKYEVAVWEERGYTHLDFNAYFLVKNKFRAYEFCSAGQKTICDLDFLNKLFVTNIGVLVLDEYLKHLDEGHFTIANEILSKINANTVILSTHDDNLTGYTKRILLSLNDEGKTVANIT